MHPYETASDSFIGDDQYHLRLRAHKNRGGVRVHTNIIPFFVQASELPCIRMKLPVTVS